MSAHDVNRKPRSRQGIGFLDEPGIRGGLAGCDQADAFHDGFRDSRYNAS